jgi:hypothetical protein
LARNSFTSKLPLLEAMPDRPILPHSVVTFLFETRQNGGTRACETWRTIENAEAKPTDGQMERDVPCYGCVHLLRPHQCR